AAHNVLDVAAAAPAGTALVLLRSSAAVGASQSSTDGAGVWRRTSSRAVPPQIGGAQPLSAQLGGLVVAPDARASIDVPMGALRSDTAISVTTLTKETAAPVPAGMVLVGAVQVSPLGLKFKQAATLEF